MLVATLVLLGFVSVLAAVILTMTSTATKTAVGYRADALRVTAADNALERVVNELRVERLAAGQDCYGATSNGSGHPTSFLQQVSLPDGTDIDVIVDCETTGALTPVRDVTLTAYVGVDERRLGVARVEITDRVGTESRPGIELVVCDWQLGQNVAGSATACS